MKTIKDLDRAERRRRASTRTPMQAAKGIAAYEIRRRLRTGLLCPTCDDGTCDRCRAVCKALEKLAERLDGEAGQGPSKEENK